VHLLHFWEETCCLHTAFPACTACHLPGGMGGLFSILMGAGGWEMPALPAMPGRRRESGRGCLPAISGNIRETIPDSYQLSFHSRRSLSILSVPEGYFGD